MGVVIPHKIRNCRECEKDRLSENCDKLVNQNKEFFAKLNETKRQLPKEIGLMLPKYIFTWKSLLSYKWL